MVTNDVDGAKLSRLTLADRLMNQLQEQILSGRLRPNEFMPSEKEIGEAFGVGRTTVREALQGLTATGFLERRGNRLVVCDPLLIGSNEVDYAVLAARLSVQEVFETRQLLEVEMARLAARLRTDDDLRQMRGLLEEMHTDDTELYHTVDIGLHTAIARASKNMVLAEVYASSTHLFFKLPAFWRVFSAEAPSEEQAKGTFVGGGHAGHLAIVEAIAARDEDTAAREAFEHLERVKQNLIRRIARSESTTRADAQGSIEHQ